MGEITVCIPHLPERSAFLERALASVEAQTLRPDAVVVEADPERTGEAATRNRALAKVSTPLVAWLDDDDELLPWHLETLAEEIKATGVDLVHSDYETIGAPGYRASFIEVAHLSRTDRLRSVGGFPQPFSDTWPYRYPDWGLLALLLNRGAVFRYVPVVTWRHHIHDSNTVGTGF